jgi:hypothetical protein
MNELDRKIAELKGYWTKNWPVVCENPEYREETRVECNWSTSDTKALELVDELVDGPEKLPFELLILSETRSGRWMARFHYASSQQSPQGGVGATRPEAICRAYVAAMEWMKGRKC